MDVSLFESTVCFQMLWTLNKSLEIRNRMFKLGGCIYFSIYSIVSGDKQFQMWESLFCYFSGGHIH